MGELHRAAARGDLGKVRELIERGADVNARDNSGGTPLHWAAGIGRLDVARLLIEHGAYVDARDNYGWTPLHVAAYWGYVEVARLLIEHGADVNARDNDGRTPLHAAASSGWSHCVEVVKLLLEQGADVYAKDKEGRTPMDLARKRGEDVGREIVKLLKSAVKQKLPVRRLLASVEAPRLVVGEWGVLRVRLGGKARVSLEGDVDWLDPGETIGVAVIPVKPRKAGRLPVALVARWEGGEERRVVWLVVAERAERFSLREQATLRACPSCGAPAEPGARYCWRCGARLQ